ncbi:MAG TPA: aquaporin [Longimicrobiales bacterium]
MMRKLVVEAIGTFFLVLTVGLVATAASPPLLGPVAIGSMLMVMVYAGGHISGGHYNPAVTLGVFMRGRATAAELVAYWITQLVAGAIAGFVATQFAEVAAQPGLIDMAPAAVIEFVFTFALVYVVLNTATTKGTEGNSYFGLAIGFTVVIGAIAGGPISGGAFNPAVGLGLKITGLATFGTLLMYLVVNLAAGLVAGLVFRVLDLGNDKPTTATPAEQGRLRQAASTGA